MLMLVFSFPLIAPLFTSGPDDADLPACCRRNGKHHCAMAGMMVQAESRYVTVSERCPYSPFAHVALMLPHYFVPDTRPPSSISGSGPSTPVRAAEAGYRISADRSRQKRGPPFLMAL